MIHNKLAWPPKNVCSIWFLLQFTCIICTRWKRKAKPWRNSMRWLHGWPSHCPNDTRFLIVFMNFVNNPQFQKSYTPLKIALFTTLFAQRELIFSLIENGQLWGKCRCESVFFDHYFDWLTVGNSLHTDGWDFVEPAKDGRTCLNCGADISHRLIMVKYWTDQCRLERFCQMMKNRGNDWDYGRLNKGKIPKTNGNHSPINN